MTGRFAVAPSEHLIEPEPEDRAALGPDADGLGEVDAEGGALEEGEERRRRAARPTPTPWTTGPQSPRRYDWPTS